MLGPWGSRSQFGMLTFVANRRVASNGGARGLVAAIRDRRARALPGRGLWARRFAASSLRAGISRAARRRSVRFPGRADRAGSSAAPGKVRPSPSARLAVGDFPHRDACLWAVAVGLKLVGDCLDDLTEGDDP